MFILEHASASIIAEKTPLSPGLYDGLSNCGRW